MNAIGLNWIVGWRPCESYRRPLLPPFVVRSRGSGITDRPDNNIEILHMMRLKCMYVAHTFS